MPQLSQFSTAENYKKLQDALTQIDQAIAEAELAVQGGVPNADSMLQQSKEAKSKIQQLLNTYFPTGTAPAK